MIAQVIVNNVPPYALQKDFLFWTVRYVDKELWFYGAWEDEDKAKISLSELENGLIVKNPTIR